MTNEPFECIIQERGAGKIKYLEEENMRLRNKLEEKHKRLVSTILYYHRLTEYYGLLCAKYELAEETKELRKICDELEKYFEEVKDEQN